MHTYIKVSKNEIPVSDAPITTILVFIVIYSKKKNIINFNYYMILSKYNLFFFLNIHTFGSYKRFVVSKEIL